MGGYSVFHYAVESKHNIVAGDLNCPACNLEYEIYCNRTPILTSFFGSAMAYCDDFDTYVHEHSPLNMIGKLKKYPIGLRSVCRICFLSSCSIPLR